MKDLRKTRWFLAMVLLAASSIANAADGHDAVSGLPLLPQQVKSERDCDVYGYQGAGNSSLLSQRLDQQSHEMRDTVTKPFEKAMRDYQLAAAQGKVKMDAMQLMLPNQAAQEISEGQQKLGHCIQPVALLDQNTRAAKQALASKLDPLKAATRNALKACPQVDHGGEGGPGPEASCIDPINKRYAEQSQKLIEQFVSDANGALSVTKGQLLACQSLSESVNAKYYAQASTSFKGYFDPRLDAANTLGLAAQLAAGAAGLCGDAATAPRL